MIKQIKGKLLHYSWDLAFGHYSESMLKNGLAASDYHIVGNPYKNKWFADPFIYKDSPDQLELFVEEFDYSIGRGRIGHLVISKGGGKITRRQEAPKCYEYNGAVYVINPSSLKFMHMNDFKNIRFCEMSEIHSVDLDTMLDWKYAELLIDEKLV